MANPVASGQVSFPPQSSPVQQGLAFTPAWYRFLQGLFDRTGGGSGAPTLNPQSSGDGIQSSPTMLVSGVNFITASGGFAQLPSGLNSGQYTVVVNTKPSKPLSVLPPAGAQINSLGTGTPYVMNPAGAIAGPTFQFFWFESGTQCWAGKLS